MKTLTGHHINDCNKEIEIQVTARNPKSGASAAYQINVKGPGQPPFPTTTVLKFQDGPVIKKDDGTVEGVNGITHETLNEVLIDRFEGLQTGEFACEENAEVLGHYNAIKEILARRTQRRKDAGIEGSHTPDPK